MNDIYMTFEEYQTLKKGKTYTYKNPTGYDKHITWTVEDVVDGHVIYKSVSGPTPGFRHCKSYDKLAKWKEYVPPKPKRDYVFVWFHPGENHKQFEAVGQIFPKDHPKLDRELYRQEISFDPNKVKSSLG